MIFDKDISFEILWDTRRLTDKPCLVYAVIVCSAPATAETLTLRDGATPDAVAKLVLQASINDSAVLVLNEPIFFSKGIWAEFSTDLTVAMIQYKLLP
jgi:hypothetical protein